ncbi:hypothetical protein GCM10011321_31510 [Youhaiella tibetensis]|uniref:Uncharacterized protein n=1 Tax=Paradevosia tibetensis TaxID=1447062 RepID=A0A5B9DKJ1_9HYPH|nr:hypothetical protein [Youhaiella tibetensis]QEE18888.1 hypothetical protein FNA67_01260 [Youhaiella tibetensis]GGF38247.1 hypothetical protein GCM10011321_31510 [Youhaiella tibetensis]
MSLVWAGLRIAAVEALKGRTEAGNEVLDSEIGAIEPRADGTVDIGIERRYVAVYTQAGDVEADSLDPRALLEGGTVELLFEAGVTATMHVRDEQTGAQQIFEGIPSTDANFELYLDLIFRQVTNALLDPDNEWAEIWRSFVLRVVKVERFRIADAQNVRLAGRQMKVICQVVDDPLQGQRLDSAGALSMLLARLEASDDEQNRNRAVLLRAAIGAPGQPDWRSAQPAQGMTGNEFAALGLQPPATDDGNDLVGATELVLETDLGTVEVTP